MNEGAVRVLRIAVVAMGVLIVVGVVTLVAAVVMRAPRPVPGPVSGQVPGPATIPGSMPDVAPLDRPLDEPPGTHVAGVAIGPDRITLTLQGGGPDRVLLLDARTGALLARLRLVR